MRKRILPLAMLSLLLGACTSNPQPAPSQSSNPSDPASSGDTAQTSEPSDVTTIDLSDTSKVSDSSDKTSQSTDTGGGSSSSAQSTEEGEKEDVIYTGKLRIWYHRDDMNYDKLRIYLWNSSVDGQEYEWTGEDAEYGVYFDIDLATSEQFAEFPSTDIRMIVKYAGSWSGQSLDTFCYFKDFEIDDEGVMNIYSAKGEGSSVDLFAKRSDALGDHFDVAYFSNDWKTIVITGTGTQGSRPASSVGLIYSYELYGFTPEYYNLKTAARAEHEAEFKIAEGTLSPSQQTAKLQLKLADKASLTTQYEIRGTFVSDTTKKKSKAISVRTLFDTQDFKNNYVYDGNDLGVTINADGTKTFKVWAPTSSHVAVRAYLTGSPWNLIGGKVVDLSADFPMEYAGKGVWTLTRKFTQKWYNYVATNGNGVVEAVDPYAKATGLNGERGAILDWNDADKVDPEGWNGGAAVDGNLTTIASANNLTVYEIHVRDLTSDSTWKSNKGNHRGTYNAFCEAGTTYNGVTTGFDHIKELGVNAIQLLPVFDQDNDERISSVFKTTEGEGTLNGKTYNWGYNPLNYNGVEGAYCSDPEQADLAVREYKNLILQYSKSDIRVIMDVVYNHMGSVANNSFTKLVPFYFFRTDANGFYTDGSGCGNEFATERAMASKFIVDSVAWWASEYRVKGFRFDLMGCIDINTMKGIRAAVNKIDPTIVLYGEGWTGGGTALAGDLQSSTNNVYAKLNTNTNFPVGCFNDAGRDGSKGNTKWADVVPNGGWINEASNIDNVYNALTQIIGENRWAKQACGGDSFNMNPNQTVNYLACHDNYTLYDQINYLFYGHDSTFGDGTHQYVMQAATALTALSLMGEGIGFIHGGDEFFRQKLMSSDDELFQELVESYRHATNGTDSWIEGDGVRITDDLWLVRNSYKYGDNVNGFRWDRKANPTIKTYYQSIRNMVGVRKAEMGNTLGQNITQIKNDGATCWSYNDLFNQDGSSKTDLLAGAFKGQKDGKYAYIFVNKGNGPASIGIGNGKMTVLYSSTSDRKAGDTFNITTNSITVPKFGALIVRAG